MNTLDAIRYRLRTWDTSKTALRDFVDHAIEDFETLLEIAEVVGEHPLEDAEKALSLLGDHDPDDLRQLAEVVGSVPIGELREVCELLERYGLEELQRLVKLGEEKSGFDVEP